MKFEIKSPALELLALGVIVTAAGASVREHILHNGDVESYVDCSKRAKKLGDNIFLATYPKTTKDKLSSSGDLENPSFHIAIFERIHPNARIIGLRNISGFIFRNENLTNQQIKIMGTDKKIDPNQLLFIAREKTPAEIRHDKDLAASSND